MALNDIMELENDEPACMDKIYKYLEEIIEEDDMFMEILLKALHGEEITWSQPWYQQTNSVTRPYKGGENDENHEDSYRKDTICKDENELIIKNWKEFIQIYDIPDKPICLARWKTKGCRLPSTPEECARRFVISYLGRGLQRTLFQIFRHIQTYFGGPVKGAYSAQEEKIMQLCFTYQPTDSVVLLSKVLGREPRGIYKRLNQMYYGKPDKKKLKWTLPLATKFLNYLIKYTGVPLEELRNREIDKEVWLKMGTKFDHNYVYLRNFWYDKLRIQLFVQKYVQLNKVRRKVFKKLRLSTYKIWSDIRWKNIARDFSEEYTSYFIYQLCYRIACQKDNFRKIPLLEVLDFALKRLKKTRNRRLRTLKLNENRELEETVYTRI